MMGEGGVSNASRHCFFSSLLFIGNTAGLKAGVTHGGLRALASSGCGKNLAFLDPAGECLEV